jgi:hypothetical protein
MTNHCNNKWWITIYYLWYCPIDSDGDMSVYLSNIIQSVDLSIMIHQVCYEYNSAQYVCMWGSNYLYIVHVRGEIWIAILFYYKIVLLHQTPLYSAPNHPIQNSSNSEPISLLWEWRHLGQDVELKQPKSKISNFPLQMTDEDDASDLTTLL